MRGRGRWSHTRRYPLTLALTGSRRLPARGGRRPLPARRGEGDQPFPNRDGPYAYLARRPVRIPLSPRAGRGPRRPRRRRGEAAAGGEGARPEEPYPESTPHPRPDGLTSPPGKGRTTSSPRPAGRGVGVVADQPFTPRRAWWLRAVRTSGPAHRGCSRRRRGGRYSSPGPRRSLPGAGARTGSRSRSPRRWCACAG